ncbi:protein phosphatase 1G [Denticeps clupeoides]|uniref:Protein phosphatase 1G n=1 Tax=Denticeps clupeoides TaxID=299321 RepID=A0AAY4E546_9TELE|nr:protein phosphatase 1G [Denticeps clupeoides]
MGTYLSQPNTVKSTADGGNGSLGYGFAAMQGWRISMEDAHNCIPNLDCETAMFAVYDGHGGEEVALYCSKYLPEIIKEQKAYKEGKLQKALEGSFLTIDSQITTEDAIKELAQIAGRPQDDTTNEKVADEDDLDNEEAALLHEEATMTIEELLTRFGQNAAKHAKRTSSDATKGPDDDEKPEKGINGETEQEASQPITNSKAKPGESGEKVGGSKLRACRRAAMVDSSGSASGSSKVGKGDSEGGLTGDAGPSCSSSASEPQGSTKSKFFEDSEESEDGEDEGEESDEDCSEEDEGEYTSENDEEDDTEELDEDDSEDEEEEMCLPGMDGKEEPGSDSGTTAVVALIRGKQLIVANAGDSRCVVSERGKAFDMSYDHKPEDEVELTRIKNAGGKVTMDGRVNGGLNLSRAIGDHFYKRNKALPPEEQMISALPDVKVLTLNEEHDFMVLACDGIWNVMSSQEVIDFVSERMKPKDGEARSLSSIVEELLDHCLAPDTSGDGTGCDNMTCVIVTFSPQPEACKKRKPEDAEENGSDSKKSKTE